MVAATEVTWGSETAEFEGGCLKDGHTSVDPKQPPLLMSIQHEAVFVLLVKAHLNWKHLHEVAPTRRN